jgi:hypothetical protein
MNDARLFLKPPVWRQSNSGSNIKQVENGMLPFSNEIVDNRFPFFKEIEVSRLICRFLAASAVDFERN